MPAHPRWLFAAHDATLYGATRSLLLLLEALPDPAQALLVVPSDGPLVARSEALGIRTEIVARDPGPMLNPLQRLAHTRRLSRAMREWRPRSVLVNTMAQSAPVMAATANGLPVLLHVREHPGYFKPKHALARTRLRALMKRPRMIVCVSEATRRLVLDAGGKPDRVDVVYNGVDVETFAPDRERRRKWRQRHGFDEGQLLFGFVGQLIHRKGWDLFVDAATQLDRPEARFVIVGASDDAPDRQALEAKRTALGKRLTLEPFTDDVRAAFDGIDVFVNPTRAEPFARVNLEAMALGKPVIATDVGGNPEAVVDGRTGRIVPAEAASLAQAMRQLCDDADLRDEMGRAGRRRVTERFTAARYQQAMLAHLDSLAGD